MKDARADHEHDEGDHYTEDGGLDCCFHVNCLVVHEDELLVQVGGYDITQTFARGVEILVTYFNELIVLAPRETFRVQPEGIKLFALDRYSDIFYLGAIPANLVGVAACTKRLDWKSGNERQTKQIGIT